MRDVNAHKKYEEKMRLVRPYVKILEEYSGARVLIKHVCECGSEFEEIPYRMLRGSKCVSCKEIASMERNKLIGNNVKLTHEQYLKRLIDSGNLAMPLEQYNGMNTKILHKCKCGNENWNTSPSDVIRGQNCIDCSGRKHKTHDEYCKQVFKLIGDEYTVLGKYTRANDKVKMRHNLCGYEWDAIPRTFTSKQSSRCPACGVSKGETRIKKFLDENKISNNIQHTFDNLFGVKHGLLMFDHVVYFDNNQSDDNIFVLIEYQGEQHDHPVLFKNEDIDKYKATHEKLLKHDNRKREYCKKNDIKLIEIWYYDFDNIEEILRRELAPLLNK